ncbi:hypothetical protein [Niallia nealsonii]
MSDYEAAIHMAKVNDKYVPLVEDTMINQFSHKNLPLLL